MATPAAMLSLPMPEMGKSLLALSQQRENKTSAITNTVHGKEFVGLASAGFALP